MSSSLFSSEPENGSSEEGEEEEEEEDVLSAVSQSRVGGYLLLVSKETLSRVYKFELVYVYVQCLIQGGGGGNTDFLP